MKTITIKIIAGCTLFASVALSSFGQAPVVGINDGGRMPERMQSSNVPNVVTEAYVIDYPGSTAESWYVYPSYNYSDGTDWYIYSPSLVQGAPEYYVVEFVTAETPYKVVYTKEGKRITTYRSMSAEVPAAVATALSKSAYKNWTITKEKEEIWRDSDKKKVYKVVVEKGKEKHFLYYQEDGKLLKDKMKS